MRKNLLLSSSPLLRLACGMAVSAGMALPLMAAKPKADPHTGAQLYRDRGCLRCHGENLEGTKKGPALAAIRKQKQWKAEQITNQITNGGQNMPPFGDALTPQEVEQLIAFLRAKHRPSVPPATPAPAQ